MEKSRAGDKLVQKKLIKRWERDPPLRNLTRQHLAECSGVLSGVIVCQSCFPSLVFQLYCGRNLPLIFLQRRRACKVSRGSQDPANGVCSWEEPSSHLQLVTYFTIDLAWLQKSCNLSYTFFSNRETYKSGHMSGEVNIFYI